MVMMMLMLLSDWYCLFGINVVAVAGDQYYCMFDRIIDFFAQNCHLSLLLYLHQQEDCFHKKQSLEQLLCVDMLLM